MLRVRMLQGKDVHANKKAVVVSTRIGVSVSVSGLGLNELGGYRSTTSTSWISLR